MTMQLQRIIMSAMIGCLVSVSSVWADAMVSDIQSQPTVTESTASATSQTSTDSSSTYASLQRFNSLGKTKTQAAQSTAHATSGAPVTQMAAPAQTVSNDTMDGLPPVVEVKADSGSASGMIVSSDTTISSAPVNNGSTASVLTGGSADTQSMTAEQRLARLEQQMKNLMTMNLSQQIQDIQAQMQQLSGQLEVQHNDLETLNKQQRSFYKDLDQRIKQQSNSSTDATTTMPTTSNVELQESNAYKTAIGLLYKKDYTNATKDFLQYLSDYPNGTYVSNSHYWLGEIYFDSKKYDSAATEFNTVISKYPQSTQVADAEFKLALVYVRTNKQDKASELLKKVKKDFPNSSAAQLATIQLQRLGLDKK